jgi:hypothetical protein
MIKKDFVRRTNLRRRTLVIVMALMVSLASLGVAGPALAKRPPKGPAPKAPTGEWAVFNQCPRFTEGVSDCIYNVIGSGEMVFNKLTIPVVNPITFQFGFGGGGEDIHAVAPLNGEFLSSTPESVPGGLSSLIDCNEFRGRWLTRVLQELCRRTFQHTRFQNVNVITELASPVSELFFDAEHELNEQGVGLRLPVKIRLENPLLGNHCYIGSNAEPVVYELTTGTTSPPPPNKPIKGDEGEFTFNESFTLVNQKNHTAVDNAFSVPAAKGCGRFFSIPIDRMINNKIGLPSPAGQNTIIFNTNGSDGSSASVVASEQ